MLTYSSTEETCNLGLNFFSSPILILSKLFFELTLSKIFISTKFTSLAKDFKLNISANLHTETNDSLTGEKSIKSLREYQVFIRYYLRKPRLINYRQNIFEYMADRGERLIRLLNNNVKYDYNLIVKVLNRIFLLCIF